MKTSLTRPRLLPLPLAQAWARLRAARLPHWLAAPLLAFALSRLLVFGFGFLGDVMLPTEDGHWQADPESAFLSLWAKWDSQDYVDIATNGYWYQPEQPSNVVFFPVYPLLMRLAAPLVGGHLIWAGFWVSNLAFAGALIVLYRLTELELGAEAAGRTVTYLAFFPTAFFFSCVYTESVFLLLAVGAAYCGRRQQWLAAAVLGMLAAATRNLGVLMFGVVLWQWFQAQGWEVRTALTRAAWGRLWAGFRQRWAEVVVIGLIPLGLVAYMLFLDRNFERPLAFIETQAAWGRQNIGPVAVLLKSLTSLATTTVGKGWLTQFVNTAALLAFLALVPAIARRLGTGYAVMVLIMLLVPAASSTGSLIRYVLPLFPAFMLLGAWGRQPAVDRALLAGFALGQGVLVSVFVNWVFVA